MNSNSGREPKTDPERWILDEWKWNAFQKLNNKNTNLFYYCID